MTGVQTCALPISACLIGINKNWSDHALWWEQKQQWLLRTSWTLEKYEIHADASLSLTPQHKALRLGMPNGATLRLRACFSSPVFQTVMEIGRLLSKAASPQSHTFTFSHLSDTLIQSDLQ